MLAFLVTLASTVRLLREIMKIDTTQEVSRTAYYRLSIDEKRLVDELRTRTKNQLTDRYDTDFNLYRWIKLAERTSKKGAVEMAVKPLRNHLRHRKALNLDSDDLPSMDENPLFVHGIIPRGFLHYLPSNNRFLWWIDYSEIDVEGILNTYKSRDVLIWHLWQFEHVLRAVNECENKTAALSGVYAVMDVKSFRLSQAFMSSIKNGHANYLTQLIHYEHYPELVCPVQMINVSKVLTFPYKLIRPLMPHDFAEKFRLSDSNFKRDLLTQMTEDELPEQLGGKNRHALAPVAPKRLDPLHYHRRKSELVRAVSLPSENILHIQVPARKRKIQMVECQAGSTINWHIESDAEITFGLYFATVKTKHDLETGHHDKTDILEKMDIVVPAMLIVTKVPEAGSDTCSENGTYYILLCNKMSWICRRNIQAKITVDGDVKKDLAEYKWDS